MKWFDELQWKIISQLEKMCPMHHWVINYLTYTTAFGLRDRLDNLSTQWRAKSRGDSLESMMSCSRDSKKLF